MKRFVLCIYACAITDLFLDVSTLTLSNKQITFTFHNYKKTWNEALAICMANNGSLVKDDSPERRNALETFGLNWPVEHIWVGLHYPSTESGDRYGWTDCVIQDLTLYANWYDGEPKDTSIERCCYANKDTGNWKSHECNKDKHFVCQNEGGTCTFTEGTGIPDQSSEYKILTSDANTINDCQQQCLTQTHNYTNCWATNYNGSTCVMYFTSLPFLFASLGRSSDAIAFLIKDCYISSLDSTDDTTVTVTNSLEPNTNCTTFTEQTTPAITTTSTSTTSTSTTSTTSTSTSSSRSTTSSTSTSTTSTTSASTSASTTRTTSTTSHTTIPTSTTSLTSTSSTSTQFLNTTTPSPSTTTTSMSPTSTTTHTPTDSTTTSTVSITTTFAPSTYISTTSNAPISTSQASTTPKSSSNTTTLGSQTSSSVSSSTSTEQPGQTSSTSSQSTKSQTNITSNSTATSSSATENSTCLCKCTEITSQLSNLTLDQKLDLMRWKLKLDFKVLSSSIRKRTSASDDRTSAKSVGYVAIVFLCLEFSFIVFIDIAKYYFKI